MLRVRAAVPDELVACVLLTRDLLASDLTRLISKGGPVS
jgi:hypothetical protein